MSRITDIAKMMKTWWDENDDPFVHRALDEIIRIDQEQAPTIEPKHGEWIDFKNGWKCNACEKWNSEKSKFCPHCGADMGKVRKVSDEAQDRDST